MNILQTPSQANPKLVAAMPNFRLLIPNMELLARILARCLSICELPDTKLYAARPKKALPPIHSDDWLARFFVFAVYHMVGSTIKTGCQ